MAIGIDYDNAKEHKVSPISPKAGNIGGTEAQLAEPDRESADARALEAARKELRVTVRDLLRAARHLSQYPEGHPTAIATVEQATTNLSRSLRTHQAVVIQVSGADLLLNGIPVAHPNDTESRLITDFKKRYIRSIILRPGVSGDNLLALFRLLTEDPNSIRQKGGARKALSAPSGAALEIMEMDYEKAVTLSEAREKGMASRPITEGLPEIPPTAPARPLLSFDEVRTLMDDPEGLASIVEEMVGLPTSGEAGAGVGGTTGEGGGGLGTGSQTVSGGSGSGTVLAPEQLLRLDVQAQAMVLLLSRVRDQIMNEGADEAEATRKMLRVLQAMEPAARARLFRAPPVESERGDVLAEAAKFMSEEELLDLVIPGPQQLTADTSERIRRVLKRCGGKVSALAPLAVDRLNQWSLPEEIYINTVELIASEMREQESPLPESPFLPFEPEKKGAVSAEIITDLLSSLEPAQAARARTEVFSEMLERETVQEKYRSLTIALEAAVEEMLDLGMPDLARRIVETLYNHSTDPQSGKWRRNRAGLALTEIKKQSLLAKVQSGLDKARGEQAADYVFLLCLSGAAGAERLAAILSDNKKSALHDSAAAALASLAPEVGSLVQKLTASLPWTVSARVAAYLAASGDERALGHVAAMLRHRDWQVRRAAVEALGKARGRAVDLLVMALSDKDMDVRLAAVGHLTALADPRTVEPLLTVATRRTLLGGNQALRLRAIAALAEMGQPAVEALGQILTRRFRLRRRSEEELSLAAAKALAQIGTDEARATLARGAGETTGELRQACLEALAGIESRVSRILEQEI